MAATLSSPATLAEILATLAEEADPAAVVAMSEQYGIHAESSYGVPMRRLLQLGKAAGTDHELAQQLWAEGSYEARTIAALVDDPHQVDAKQMQQWCQDFDNWAIVDTVCFRLFDKTSDAWSKVDEWVTDERLFVKRAGFALIWGLALHVRNAPEHHLHRAVGHARAQAADPRPLVGKAITMSLRAIATKQPYLRDDVVSLATDLSNASDPAARRVGRPIVRSFC